jgi:23S rRNA (cytidine1920-2'-O)/16S rRNA (cytidine1409-2'-O)-methyltransferase
LIKPQFEAGREAVGKGGVVRDEAAREAAVTRVRNFVAGVSGWSVLGVMPSPIEGGSGNKEFLLAASYEQS